MSPSQRLPGNLGLALSALLALVGCAQDEDADLGPIIETFAGIAGVQQFGPEGTPATESALNLVIDVTIAPNGDVYVLDFNNHRIRKVDANGIVQTVTGTGMLGDGILDENGDGTEGPAMQVAWNHPTNAVFAPGDPENLWIAAWHNSRINRLNLTESYLYFEAGTGGRSFSGDGGPAREAVLDLPSSVSFDADGNLYVSDQANQIIRRIDPDGIIETIAGTQREFGYAGDGGPASEAKFHGHVGQAADPSNRLLVHDRLLYLADTRNQLIRVIDLDTGIIDRVAGIFEDNGETDILRAGGVLAYGGDGGDPLEARFANPRDIAIGPDGELYIADTENHCVRVIQDGIIDTFAGTCGVAGNDAEGVPPREALLHTPYGIEVDAQGNVYIADTYNHAVRIVRR